MLKMTQHSEASLTRLEESPQTTPQKETEENLKFAQLTDMEKVIMSSNDKISVQELWREPPQVDFPVNSYRQINIQEIRDDICGKADTLKDKIEKRRMQQRKIANEKEEAHAREQQRKAEQRQQRIEQVESKREEMKKRSFQTKKGDVKYKEPD